MSLVPIFNHSEDAMQAADFHFRNIKVTVSVSCITGQRLQIHSLMEQRITNHTFTAGSRAVLLDILRKFIVFRSIYKFFFKGYHRKLIAKTRGLFRIRSNIQVESFAKIVDSFQSLTTFTKLIHHSCLTGFKCTPGSKQQIVKK